MMVVYIQLNADSHMSISESPEPNGIWPYGFEGKLRHYESQEISVTRIQKEIDLYVVVHDF